MSLDPYSDRVRALFAAPDHAGEIDGGVSVRADDQGVRLCLSAVSDADRVAKMRFRAWACPHLIAAAEAACAQLEGEPAQALLEFSTSDLMQSLPVPKEKTGRILVLEDAVRALGTSLRDAAGRN